MRKSRQTQLAETGIFHKFFKGHNGERILNTPAEKQVYLECLARTKKNPKIAPHIQLHSYCLMSNHPHEVGRAGWDISIKSARPVGIQALGNWMRNAHSQFGRWYNDANQRFGKVSNERAKTRQLSSEVDIINTMLYADANPVRAKMATHPSKYQWSSYRFYAYGETNEFTDILDVPAAYLALGKTPAQRQRAYRSLMDAYLRQNGLLDDAPEEDVVDLSMYECTYHRVMALMSMAAQRAGPNP